MSSFAPAPELTESLADEGIPFDKTLAVANTSEMLFTVPGGKRLLSLLVFNDSPAEDAHIALAAGNPATTADFRLGRRGAASLDRLGFSSGTYDFIGGTGDTPTVRGLALVG